MDRIDRKILATLQTDGRISITDLASHVRLSLSACHRRVRELERGGAIVGYRAVLDPAVLGLGFEARVFVTLGRTDVETIAAFEAAVLDIPHIVDAERLFGDTDYILRVVAADLSAYQDLYDRTLGGLPGVLRLTSTLVMKRLDTDTTLPLDPQAAKRRP